MSDFSDVMDKMSYGRVALRKFGAVPNNFHIFEAGWIGDKPENWTHMKVKGAQFIGMRRVPHTTMTTIVTVEEMKAEEAA